MGKQIRGTHNENHFISDTYNYMCHNGCNSTMSVTSPANAPTTSAARSRPNGNPAMPTGGAGMYSEIPTRFTEVHPRSPAGHTENSTGVSPASSGCTEANPGVSTKVCAGRPGMPEANAGRRSTGSDGKAILMFVWLLFLCSFMFGCVNASLSGKIKQDDVTQNPQYEAEASIQTTKEKVYDLLTGPFNNGTWRKIIAQ